MAQEDHHVLKSSHSGGGGGGDGGGGNFSGRSKNVKQKKIPQRGLGVAQLEKIRVEEQRKKEALQAANALAKNAVDTNFQCPSFRQIPQPPPQSPTNLHSPNSLYRRAPSVPGIEMGSGSVQLRKQFSAGGGEIGNWPRLWNGDLQGEKQRAVDHVGFTFGQQANLQHESSPSSHVLPVPSVHLRSHQFQPPSSSVVNAASGISPSSVLSSQMEPPSNQNFRSNSYTSSLPEEDRVVGMKRSYPFSLETPASPSFSGNFRPTNYAASESRSDELASGSNTYTPHVEPRNKHIRESPSNQNPLSRWNPVEVIKDEGKLNGDFLKLAPPSPASPPLQENCESQITRLETSTSMEQPFSFFPVKSDICRPSTSASSGNGEKGEALDLSLKL